jgi:hypothetical protein
MKIQKAKLTIFIFTGLFILGVSFLVYAQNNASTSDNIFLDSDQDGLSNAEEKIYGTDPYNADTDGDGYTDGEEVKSGYDPLKPAPGDKLPVAQDDQTAQDNITNAQVTSSAISATSTASTPSTDSQTPSVAGTSITNSSASTNLTQQLSDEVNNLISEKAANNEQISVDDLDNIINKITSSKMTADDLPNIDEKSIKVLKQNYSSLSKDEQKVKEKEDDIKYLTAVAYILANNSPKKISSESDINNLTSEIISQATNFATSLNNISYFEDLANRGQTIMDQLKDVEVPQNLLDLHIQALKIATYAISLKDTAKPDTNDPVAAMSDLPKAENVITLTQSLINEMSTRLSDLGITNIPLNL